MNRPCQKCKKAVATIHLTEIEHGEKREKHLCEQCAVNEDIQIQPKHVSFNQILTDFVVQQAQTERKMDQTCKACGASFGDFRHVGLLGCPSCYDAFEPALKPLLQRAHGNELRHVGKSPRRKSTDTNGRQEAARERARLERELQQAIDREDFEQAARVRDDLRTLDTK
jgi:protein arginine kinase activator